jgi:hypothetical protein
MKHSLASAVILAAIGFLSLLRNPTEAAERCRDITLPSGSATAAGLTAKEGSDLTCFQLHAPMGAMARLRFMPPASRDIAFNIEGVTDNQDDYTFRVEKPAYKVSVYNTFRRSRPGPFKLSASLIAGRSTSGNGKASVPATPQVRFAPYVGVWAPTAAACKGGGRDVFRITPKGEEGREWQCDIKQASERAGGWNMSMACASEGNDYNETMRWVMDKSGRLHEEIGRKTKTYVRCSDGDFRETESD